MVMHRWRLLPVIGLVFFTTYGSAAPAKPQQVLDLHYGEVLYQFYQQDYFTAITHLMVARKQGLLSHQRKAAELLLGGLQLSYGMLDEAQARFHRLLDTETGADSDLHDRVWYYLAKINYQRGNYRKAYTTLQQAGKPHDEVLGTRLALLAANINMRLGNNTRAAETLTGVHAPGSLKDYIRINRGIALLRAGDTEQGRLVLEELGKQSSGGEELRALQDRANLGLGYQLLRSGEPEQAREYLNQVRFQGPFSQAALLGAGWADAERGDYEGALTPWMRLIIISGHQPPAQEARLAVPYAMAQMGDNKRAVYYYEQAVKYYADEQQLLDKAIETAKSGALITHLEQADTGLSGGWLNDNPILKDIPSDRYLVDVLSGNAFQETLKDYRDLGYLSGLLHHWLDNIDLYHGMVDARRQAYRQRTPGIRARLKKQEARTLQKRWQHYQALVDAADRNTDPLRLATGKEKQQWALLKKVRRKLDALPAESRYDKLRTRADWLYGVLYWQLNSDYKIRLWNTRRQLRELEPQIRDTLKKHQQLNAALEQVKAGFEGYNKRIEALRGRILALLPHIQAARHQNGQQLQQLALDELEVRKQRLLSYRSQAHYALARSYDRLTDTLGDRP